MSSKAKACGFLEHFCGREKFKQTAKFIFVYHGRKKIIQISNDTGWVNDIRILMKNKKNVFTKNFFNMQ